MVEAAGPRRAAAAAAHPASLLDTSAGASRVAAEQLERPWWQQRSTAPSYIPSRPQGSTPTPTTDSYVPATLSTADREVVSSAVNGVGPSSVVDQGFAAPSDSGSSFNVGDGEAAAAAPRWQLPPIPQPALAGAAAAMRGKAAEQPKDKEDQGTSPSTNFEATPLQPATTAARITEIPEAQHASDVADQAAPSSSRSGSQNQDDANTAQGPEVSEETNMQEEALES